MGVFEPSDVVQLPLRAKAIGQQEYSLRWASAGTADFYFLVTYFQSFTATQRFPIIK
jgi:hypothetical protein